MNLVTQVPQVKNEDKEELNKTMTLLLSGDNQTPVLDLNQTSFFLQNSLHQQNNTINGQGYGQQDQVNQSSFLTLLNDTIPEEPVIFGNDNIKLMNNSQQLCPSQETKQANIINRILLSQKQLYDIIPVLYDPNDKTISFKKQKKYMYYISSLIISANFPHLNDNFSFLFKDHYLQSFKALEYFERCIKVVPEIDQEEYKSKLIYLPDQQFKQKTLIFDLDETLIHCNQSAKIKGDTIVSIQLKPGETIKASINIRPYVKELLTTVSKYFEVIVFTASQGVYANAVIDYIDPKKEFIKYRFFRNNCIQLDSMYVKNLDIFKNRDPKDLILIDNSCFSYCCNLNNGIPIIPYYDNKNDKELLYLQDFLMELKDVDDVRIVLQDYFQYMSYKNYNNPAMLLQNLYQQF